MWSSAACLAALRRVVFLARSSLWNGVKFWSLEVLFACRVILWNCTQHLIWKIFFSFFPLASVKKASKLQGLLYCIKHSRGWKSCNFSFVSEVVARTQNPSVLDSRIERVHSTLFSWMGIKMRCWSALSEPKEASEHYRTVSSQLQ